MNTLKKSIHLLLITLIFLANAGAYRNTASNIPEASDAANRPKYIFLVIGDGMGFGHLHLGSVYHKILMDDYDAPLMWDAFTVKRSIQASGESSSGGTALSTGQITRPSVVAMNRHREDLLTILDLASAQGMATGIATNDEITGATPASFYAHARNRYDTEDIAADFTDSGIDVLLAGGLSRVLGRADRGGDYVLDAAGAGVAFDARTSHLQAYAQNGYHIFAGMQGAYDFLTLEEHPRKLVGVFTNTEMPFQGIRVQKDPEHPMHGVPTLMDLAAGGIQALSQDDDGFVFVIEEALIDKACHRQRADLTAMEMEILNRTLMVVFEFYHAHPDETLILLTADHETGQYQYDDQKALLFNQYPKMPWKQGYDAVCDTLEDLGVYYYTFPLQTGMDLASKHYWDLRQDNMALAAGAVVGPICESLGIKSLSGNHTYYPVPLYALGAGAEYFEACNNNYEIPQILCELMDWPMLPLTVPTQ